MTHVAYDDTAAAYHATRALPLDALEGWRTAVVRYLSPPPRRPVVDVGAGTGVFARAFAEWFGVRVVGVEPSSGMRAEARRRSAHPLVTWVAGAAEHLPLAHGSGSCAWLSTVVHHLSDLPAAVRELARVLVGDAPVLVRSAFPERHDHIALFRFFPGARRAAERFPTIRQVVDVFSTVGFSLERVEDVSQVSASSLAAFRAGLPRLRTADSTLVRLTDEEFACGLAAVEAALRGDDGRPVVDRLTLMVLRSGPR
jgi:ubiquinone/menaquinone biosynthesis C-methylase UbiE